MKKRVLVCACLLLSVSLFAQKNSLMGRVESVKGIEMSPYGATFGIGFSSVAIPSINLGYEHMLMPRLFDNKSSLTVGADLIWGMQSAQNFSCQKFVPQIKGNLHYRFFDFLDTYAGVSLGCGLMFDAYKANVQRGTNTFHAGFVMGIYVGASYNFWEKMSAFVQVGYHPMSYASLGVSYSLK